MSSDGEGSIRSKTLGRRRMFSSFQSRPFGLGLNPTKEQLDEVNERRKGKKYHFTPSAIRVHGSADKAKLDDDPSKRYFEFGPKGYWTGDHVIVQVEDFIDVFDVMYPNFKASFTFDQSSGHTKSQEGALTTVGMSRKWGGTQPFLRDSVLDSLCIGDNSPLLQPGDTAKHVFGPFDDPPITDPKAPQWDTICIENEEDHCLTCVELRERIADKTKDSRYVHDNKDKKDVLVKRANELGIPLVEKRYKVIPGYANKQKGAEQICIERGLVDKNKIKKYTLKPKKDKDGNVKKDTSLLALLEKQNDFMNEKCQVSQFSMVIFFSNYKYSP